LTQQDLSEARRTVEAVWRLESARLIGGLTRMVHDLDLAEELAQDALLAALEQWPSEGVPVKPGAWLMTTAKHRAIDRLRRRQNLDRKVVQLGYQAHLDQEAAMFDDQVAATVDDDVTDDVLRLMFISAHPVLSPEARTALTLRLIGGLTTAEIARAFLTSEATIAQRIVRAKKALAAAQVPFEVPPPDERAERMGSVLEVLYLIFNEGYTARAGEEWMRPDLAAEALRLVRVLAELAPRNPEAHGLAALMELHTSRMPARLDAAGDPVPLLQQNRGRWDQLLIRRGYAALLRARSLRQPYGAYVLQAAIAVCHARARTPEDTDWTQIVALYDALLHVSPTPVVRLNRAVAVAERDGPVAALAIVEELRADPTLQRYHLLPSVRADLLARVGRSSEAHADYLQAASLTANDRERGVLLRSAANLMGPRNNSHSERRD
jgi:RNA polymerase sigma factor (sigma-70 family)